MDEHTTETGNQAAIELAVHFINQAFIVICDDIYDNSELSDIVPTLNTRKYSIHA